MKKKKAKISKKVACFVDEFKGKKAVLGGLLPHKKDKRDFQVGAIFGLFPYKPLHTRHIIPTVSVKNQYPFNTCGWNAVTVQKEPDENVSLSVEKLVKIGRKNNQISGDGFSSLRGNQLMVQKFGIPEDRFSNKNVGTWEEYSRFDLNEEMIKNADNHRSLSFWEVRGRDAVLKALDQGRILETGIDWFTGFNMGGGFSAPWLITNFKGLRVGGHAFVCIGYDLNYQGKEVLVFQQSAGLEWGDKGKFYIEMNFALKNCYTFYVQLDIPIDTAKFLNDNQFKFVKGSKSAFYQIIGDKKYPFPDMATFLLYTDGKGREQVNKVADDILNAISSGPMMRIQTDPKWQMIKQLAVPDRWKEVMKHLLES